MICIYTAQAELVLGAVLHLLLRIHEHGWYFDDVVEVEVVEALLEGKVLYVLQTQRKVIP